MASATASVSPPILEFGRLKIQCLQVGDGLGTCSHDARTLSDSPGVSMRNDEPSQPAHEITPYSLYYIIHSFETLAMAPEDARINLHAPSTLCYEICRQLTTIASHNDHCYVALHRTRCGRTSLNKYRCTRRRFRRQRRRMQLLSQTPLSEIAHLTISDDSE